MLATAEIQSFTNAIIMPVGVQMIIIINNKNSNNDNKIILFKIFHFSKCVGDGSV